MSKITRERTPNYWYTYDTPLYGTSKVNLKVNSVYYELQRKAFPPLYERVVSEKEFMHSLSHRNNLVITVTNSKIERLALIEAVYTLNGRKESKPFYKTAIVYFDLVLIQNRITSDAQSKMIRDLYECYNSTPNYLYDYVRRVNEYLNSCKTQLEIKLQELNSDIDKIRSSENKWPQGRN